MLNGVLLLILPPVFNPIHENDDLKIVTFSCRTLYLWVLSTELDACHLFDAFNFVVAPSFLELCEPTIHSTETALDNAAFC